MKAACKVPDTLKFSLAPRAPFPVEVGCTEDPHAETRRYLAWNLSKGGLFLKTMFPVEVGTQLTCTFHLPDGRRPVTAVGEVVWTRKGNPTRLSPPGMGVRFYDLSELDSERLSHYVTEHVDTF